jgi:GMP synthase (glutamine-hydrolysing)
MSLRFFLLQARKPGDPARKNEQRSFAEKLGFCLDQIDCHDLLEGSPSLQKIRKYDALLIGGAGDYYVSKRNLPAFERFLELLTEIVEIGHPTFSSCFGFQCMVEALGGRIVHDPRNTQVGTYKLELTEEGARDPLLGILPGSFWAQLGRKDRADWLPDGVSNLAKSDHAPYQAFRVPGKPVWAFQFHPELSCGENRDRYMLYLKGYSAFMTPEEKAEAMNRFRESPETEQLLPRFRELVF